MAIWGGRVERTSSRSSMTSFSSTDVSRCRNSADSARMCALVDDDDDDEEDAPAPAADLPLAADADDAEAAEDDEEEEEEAVSERSSTRWRSAHASPSSCSSSTLRRSVCGGDAKTPRGKRFEKAEKFNVRSMQKKTKTREEIRFENGKSTCDQCKETTNKSIRVLLS